MGGLRLASEVIKAAVARGVARAATGQRLPTADGRIDISGIELQPVAPPAGALRGDQCRAAAEKGIQHDISAGRAVEDRVGYQSDRLHRRVQGQQIALVAAAGKGVDPGIVPHIASVAAKPAKLDIIAVSVAALFEHKDKLVPAAVERAHPATVLDPNAEVFQLVVGGSAGCQQLLDMAPVHADEVQRAVDAECREIAASLAKKAGEFVAIHLARGHREGPMVERAATTRMTT